MPGVAPYPRPDPAWLAEQYGSGRRQDDLAAELGVSRSTVRAWLHAAGIPTRPGGRPSRMPLEELEELVAAGATAYEIADRYGLHEVTVRQVCERHGLKLRPMRPSLDEETAQAICAAYAEGFTYAELAERFGVSRHWIAWLARKGRLTPRPRYVVRVPAEEILARYDAGEAPSRIAEALGVGRGSVRYWISTRRGEPPEPLRAETLRERLREGAEVRDLAAEAGVSLTVLYRAIGAAHASHLLRSRPVDPAEVRRGLAEGRSIVGLAADWNTTPDRIRRLRGRLL